MPWKPCGCWWALVALACLVHEPAVFIELWSPPFKWMLDLVTIVVYRLVNEALVHTLETRSHDHTVDDARDHQTGECSFRGGGDETHFLLFCFGERRIKSAVLKWHLLTV